MKLPTLDELKLIKFEELYPHRDDSDHSPMRYFFAEMGEHYKLLSYLSDRLPYSSEVFDIGTNTGHSAYALASNQNVTVRSYDIVDKVPDYMKRSNIFYYLQPNCLTHPLLLHAKLIFVDAMKEVEYEKQILAFLLDHHYKGTVIFDDIHIKEFPKFVHWWETLELPSNVIKKDITELGHWTGTGLLEFA